MKYFLEYKAYDRTYDGRAANTKRSKQNKFHTEFLSSCEMSLTTDLI